MSHKHSIRGSLSNTGTLSRRPDHGRHTPLFGPQAAEATHHQGVHPRPSLAGPATKPSAFTLIELVVVMAILVILVAIAAPMAGSLLTQGKVSNTRMNLDIVRQAILAFDRERPMAEAINTFCTGPGTTYSWVFGAFPPSPMSAFANPTPPGTIPPACGEIIDPGLVEAGDVSVRLNTLITTLNIGDHRFLQPVPNDFASSEALVLFMRQLSPKAKNVLDRLPASVLTNADRDCIDVNGDGQCGGVVAGSIGADIDLFEISDAWGHPIRYMVRPRYQGSTEFQWELRSAGPDERFSPMFTPEEQSGDDVILRGP